MYVSQTPSVGGWWFGSRSSPKAPAGWFPLNHLSKEPVDLKPKPRAMSMGAAASSNLRASGSSASMAASAAMAPTMAATTIGRKSPPPSSSAAGKTERVYDESTNHSLGLYEELACVMDGTLEAGADMAVSSTAVSAAAATASSSQPRKTVGFAPTVKDTPASISREQAQLEEEVTSASWFLPGLPRDQV